MPAATLSSNGHVTLASGIRLSMGVKPQDRVSLAVMPGGTASLRAKTKSMLSLRGLLQPKPGTTVSITEMGFGPSSTSWRLASL